jgi:hypothetical protein
MTNKIFEAGIFIGTVICGAGLLALLGDLLSPPSSARAENIPVTVTIPEEDNFAIFVPDGYEGIVVAGSAFPDERVF